MGFCYVGWGLVELLIVQFCVVMSLVQINEKSYWQNQFQQLYLFGFYQPVTQSLNHSLQPSLLLLIKVNQQQHSLQQQSTKIKIKFKQYPPRDKQQKPIHQPFPSPIYLPHIPPMLSMQNNYLDKYQQIYPESIEWSTIEYRLQLNLGNTSAQLKRVYCVVNPYMNQQFEKENKGMVISEVYVKPENNGSNRIERVCQKGFEISSEKGGFEFVIGQIDGFDEATILNTEEYHELLVVKVCPRKCYPCISTPQTESENFRPPEGFDSVVYKKSEQQDEIYRHRLKIFKKMQTLPYYLIRFAFKKEQHEKTKLIRCQKCQNQEGNVYCFTEKVYFCKKCDYEHHKDKISSKHERKIIKDDPILDFGYCNNHKQNKNELFCKVCNVSMCMSCKIYGDHAEGIMATHELQKVKDYYQGITGKIKEMDPNLEKRKNQLEQLLHLVNVKMTEINHTTSVLQNELKIMFEDAIKSLQAISRRKLSYLISDQLQIRRQYDYIQWMQSYLRYEYNVLPPHTFLTCWTKHTKLRKDILNIANIPPVTDIKPDFKIVGQVRVEQDGKIVMVSSTANSQNNEKNFLNLKKQLNEVKKQIQAGDALEKDKEEKDTSDFRKRLFGNNRYRPGQEYSGA